MVKYKNDLKRWRTGEYIEEENYWVEVDDSFDKNSINNTYTPRGSAKMSFDSTNPVARL